MNRSEHRQRLAQNRAAQRKARFAQFGLGLMGRVAKQRASGKGPMKWCKTCHRNHRSRETCKLYLRTRTSKAGNKMRVWAH